MLEYVPGTNQYWAIRVKFLALENNGGLWWGSIPWPPYYESDTQPTVNAEWFYLFLCLTVLRNLYTITPQYDNDNFLTLLQLF